jgi:acyl carrier protein
VPQVRPRAEGTLVISGDDIRRALAEDVAVWGEHADPLAGLDALGIDSAGAIALGVDLAQKWEAELPHEAAEFFVYGLHTGIRLGRLEGEGRT